MLAYEKLDGWKVCRELAVATYRATEHVIAEDEDDVIARAVAGPVRGSVLQDATACRRPSVPILGEVPSELLHRLLPHPRVAEPDPHVRADVLEQQRQKVAPLPVNW
jgi:hypothetical protein